VGIQIRTARWHRITITSKGVETWQMYHRASRVTPASRAELASGQITAMDERPERSQDEDSEMLDRRFVIDEISAASRTEY